MLNITIDKDIPFSLQLINTDGSFERTATVNLYIYGSDTVSLETSAGPVSYNYTSESYTHTMTPSADWITQDIGMYLAVWTVSTTASGFPDTVTDEINVFVDDKAIDDYLTSEHGSGSWLSATVDSSIIADAVWDEAKATHTAAGSFGEEVQSHSTSTELTTAESNIRGADSDDLKTLSDQLDGIDTDLTTVDGKVDIIDTNISTIDTKVDTIDTNVDTINTDLKRALGLMHENIYIDNAIYDANENLTSARVRIYSDAASVGTGANIIGTYIITSAGSDVGKFTTWQQVKV